MERFYKSKIFMDKYEPAYFTYAGLVSSKFGLKIRNDISFPSPIYDFDLEQIQGRNGDLIYFNDRMNDFELEIPCKIHIQDVRDIATLSMDIHRWLSPAHGYQRLEFSALPHHLLRAIVLEEINVEEQLRKFGEITIRFKCYPSYFAKAGEHEIEIKHGDQIVNMYNRVARPIWRVVGKGQFRVRIINESSGERIQQILGLNSDFVDDITIDSAILTAKSDSMRNPYQAIERFPFPVLFEGMTRFELTSTSTRLFVTPRWAD